MLVGDYAVRDSATIVEWEGRATTAGCVVFSFIMAAIGVAAAAACIFRGWYWAAPAALAPCILIAWAADLGQKPTRIRADFAAKRLSLWNVVRRRGIRAERVAELHARLDDVRWAELCPHDPRGSWRILFVATSEGTISVVSSDRRFLAIAEAIAISGQRFTRPALSMDSIFRFGLLAVLLAASGVVIAAAIW